MRFQNLLVSFFLLCCCDLSLFAAPSPSVNEDNTPIAPVMQLQDFLNLRDPFRKFKPKKSPLADEWALPELERFASDSYRLIGVITGTKKNKALITGPSGKMHIVTENTRIGQRKGYIKRINPSNIVIEEKVINLLGQEEKIETVLEFEDKNKERL